MAAIARKMPAKLIFESFSLKARIPISTEKITIQMLFKPNTTELSSLLLFKALIRKYNDPKLAVPSTIPPTISADETVFEIDFELTRITRIPSISAVRKTKAENNML